MHILLTNDDGITAKGFNELHKKLIKKFKITVCAPETEQSAIGHAITLNRPLRVKKSYRNSVFFGYAVNGTPADCVKIAIKCLMKNKPQLIVSGINHGPNLGSDILYSGTVSAAVEGTMAGIPSIAVSLATHEKYNFSFAADFILKIVKKLEKTKLPPGVLLNINIPAAARSKIGKVMITTQAKSLYEENFIKRIDPRGNSYYWLTGRVKWLSKPIGSDIRAIEQDHVSITPLQLDLTEYKFITDLEKMILN